MPRIVKLASVAIAIAVTTTVAGSTAYGSSPAAAPAPSVSYGSAGPGATTTLVIRHVRKGCHVWSTGTVQTASLRLNLTRRPRLQVRLRPGFLRVNLTRDARLQILNRDVVAHQLVQIAGPPLKLRGHMMSGKSQLITFSQPGVYHSKNKVVKMGPETKVTTIGPDNMLHLAVSVR